MNRVAGVEAVGREADNIGLSVPGPTRDALLTFFDLLLRWGERINLTAARSVEALAADHLPDALVIASRLALGSRTGEEIIDVGSGGGLPAIPLALLRPESRLTLVEATGKKVAFLRAAARELGIGERVRVEHRRIEAGADEPHFDVATSRAMLAPPDWLALGQGLVKAGGLVFCLASARLEGGIPAGLEVVRQACYREHRWVTELKRST